MTRKQKLELTGVGKDERPRLEPRILVEDPALSYHAAERVSDGDRFDNMLIQGDNLLALKALEHTATYGGKPWRYVLVHDADVVATADLAGILQRRGNREG
jgi:hypothetical protein